MTDNYGNYVVQICLRRAGKKDLKMLIDYIYK